MLGNTNIQKIIKRKSNWMRNAQVFNTGKCYRYCVYYKMADIHFKDRNYLFVKSSNKTYLILTSLLWIVMTQNCIYIASKFDITQ